MGMMGMVDDGSNGSMIMDGGYEMEDLELK
jgi:hypothetical protein